jgi:type II secretory pathway pseudopilin PulG
MKTRNDRAIQHHGGWAFTLIEVMVATGITGVLFIALLSGMSYGFSLVRMGRENLRATQILVEKMEQFRLFNWAQITTNGVPATFTEPFFPMTNQVDVGFYYTGSVTIASAPLTESYAGNLRLVTVSITWPSGKVIRQRETSTLVGKNGLYNYVY